MSQHEIVTNHGRARSFALLSVFDFPWFLRWTLSPSLPGLLLPQTEKVMGLVLVWAPGFPHPNKDGISEMPVLIDKAGPRAKPIKPPQPIYPLCKVPIT